MTRSTQLVVIQSESSKKFQEEFNAAMVKYQDCNPKYEFVHSLGHCAYITYTLVSKEEPKEVIFVGETCGTCTNAEKPASDRVKWRKCSYLGAAVNCNKSACEHYYPEVGDEH